MKFLLVRSTVVAAALLILCTSGIAGTKGRIIPDGTVSLQKNGTVAKFNEQTVLDENALIACDGNCMVKLQGVSLVALNQSKFAVKESSDLLNLYVEQGRVNFVVSDASQMFAFYTPDHRFVKTEGFIAPASTDNSVKGFINATDKAVEIGMERGSMIVQTDEGSQTVNAGQSILLAQAEVPSNNTPAPVKEEEEDGDKGGFLWWSSLGTAGQVGIVAVGIGAGAFVISEIVDDDDDPTTNVAPPPPPPPERPRPASPNL
ncbi:MAG: hypothetical protein ACYDBT_14155 [Desulfobulbaceae bacterium]